VARATVYLRWPSRERLIVAAVDTATGGVEYPVTDDVEADIRSASRVTRAAFAHPEFAAMFPWLVVAILARPAAVAFDAVVPKRRVLAGVYARLAAAQGLDGHVAPELAFDAVLGAHIAIFLATGAAATIKQTDQIAALVIRGLRVAPGG
jgi:AcrR family transcriptional regulator